MIVQLVITIMLFAVAAACFVTLHYIRKNKS